MTPKPTQRRYVAYFRVSTQRQGRSGLGLEAQQADVKRFLAEVGGTLLRSFTEVETGKNNDRAKLSEALKLCRLSNSVLLIAKLDRLSRNAAFLLALQDSKVGFVCCDMPQATEMVIGIMACVAQDEARRISERTKKALQAAKARGTKLGNPHLKAGTKKTAAHARTALTLKATARALDMAEQIEDARSQGLASLRAIAGHLNGLGVTTARGRAWTACAVQRICNRV